MSRAVIHLFVFILILNHSLTGQDDRPSLADIELQKIFIEANKEKLLEHYEDAAYLFQEVLKKDPDNHSAAYELARMYDVLEKDALALKTIKKAVKLAPDNIWYQDFYALVLDRNKQYEAAAQVYNGLAKKNPDNEYFLFQEASYYEKANQPTKAIVVYDRLEKVVGINEELIRKKYSLYYEMGDYKVAEKEVQKLIKIAPENTNYLHILAEFYTAIKKDNEAEKVYQQILKIDPNDADANVAMANNFKESGNHFKYLKTIEPIISQGETNIDVKIKELFPYINIISESKDQELKIYVLSLAEKLTEVHPDDAKAYSLYGDILYHAGQNQKALEAYESTLKLDKSVFPVWEQMMYINYETGKNDELIALSEKAMDYFPNQAKVYYMNGMGQFELGEYREATLMFEQALMMAGKNIELKFDLYNRLGITYFKLKKYERSNSMFDKAVSIAPEAYIALHNYSYHLALRGESLPHAEQLALKATELKPDYFPIETNMAFVYYKMEKYNDAKKWIEKALKNGGSNSPETLELYGDILIQTKNKDKAVEQWKLAKTKGGNSDSLDKKINNL